MSTTARVFVTGCAGMIGSNIATALLAAGHRVVGVDNLWRGTAGNLATLKAHANFDYRHADIAADQNWSFDVGHDDTIIHTADIVAGIGFVFANEWTIFQKNVLINTEIARIVHFREPRQLIYLGTACSYPQGLQRSTEGSVLSEAVKFPADPKSGYGWSKLIGDVEFRLAAKGKRTRLTVLDLHNVYGWPCVYRDNTSQVIPALIMKALTSPDRTLSVWGDGRQGRAFVHVSDVVAAVSSALAYQGRLRQLHDRARPLHDDRARSPTSSAVTPPSPSTASCSIRPSRPATSAATPTPPAPTPNSAGGRRSTSRPGCTT